MDGPCPIYRVCGLVNYTHLLHPEKLLCGDLCFSSVQQEAPPTRENGHLV